MKSAGSPETPPTSHRHRTQQRRFLSLAFQKIATPTRFCILFCLSFILGYLWHSQPLLSQSAADLRDHSFFLPYECGDPVPEENVRQKIIDRVFNHTSPWEGFPPKHVSSGGVILEEWTKGWGSNAPVFEHLIEKVKPKTIIEVGTFLGASAIHMVGLTRKLGLDTQVLCIDDFRGWPGYYDEGKGLKMVNGDVMMLYQFMQNVVRANASDSIMFLPFSTNTALAGLCDWGVYGDLVEVDAAHDFHSAWVDINNAYKVLKSGGILFGHDIEWAGVRKAVHIFARLHGFKVAIDDDRMSKAEIKAQLAEMAKKRRRPEVGVTIAEPGSSPPPRRPQKKRGGSDSEVPIVTIPDLESDPSGRGKDKVDVHLESELDVEPGHDVSFLSGASGPEALKFVKHLVGPTDLKMLRAAPDLQVEQSMALNFMRALVWAGEFATRAHQVRTRAHSAARDFDDIMARHQDVVGELAQLKAEREDELHSLRLELEGAQEGQKKAEDLVLELRTALKQKEQEVAAARELGKKEYLESSEFVQMCAEKAAPFFYDGFNGFLAQFRANGYSEAEHPALFLDAEKAMEEAPEEGEVSDRGGESNAKETPSSIV